MDFKNCEDFRNNSTMDLRIGFFLEITLPCARSARFFFWGILAVLQGEIVKKGVQRGPRLARFFGNNSTMKQELDFFLK